MALECSEDSASGKPSELHAPSAVGPCGVSVTGSSGQGGTAESQRPWSGDSCFCPQCGPWSVKFPRTSQGLLVGVRPGHLLSEQLCSEWRLSRCIIRLRNFPKHTQSCTSPSRERHSVVPWRTEVTASGDSLRQCSPGAQGCITRLPLLTDDYAVSGQPGMVSRKCEGLGNPTLCAGKAAL